MKYLLPFILTGCIAIAADQPGPAANNLAPATDNRLSKVRQFLESTMKHEIVFFGKVESIAEPKTGVVDLPAFKKVTFSVANWDLYTSPLPAEDVRNIIDAWIPVRTTAVVQQKYLCIGKSEPVPSAVQDAVGSEIVITCEILRSAEEIGHSLVDLLFGQQGLQYGLDNPQ